MGSFLSLNNVAALPTPNCDSKLYKKGSVLHNYIVLVRVYELGRVNAHEHSFTSFSLVFDSKSFYKFNYNC